MSMCSHMHINTPMDLYSAFSQKSPGVILGPLSQTTGAIHSTSLNSNLEIHQQRRGCTFSCFLSLSHVYTGKHTDTHIYASFTHECSKSSLDSLHSHHLPFGICRHKIKCSVCCVFVVVRLIQYSARSKPNNTTFTIGGKASIHKSISSVYL